MKSWSAPDVPSLTAAGFLPSTLPILVPDSSTHELQEIARGSDELKIYVCGITPYDATHLGHAATYLLFDTLSRVALDAGKRVSFVQNVTDVDDPLLERATATGEDWVALAERETNLFRTDMEALRIIPPAHYVGAVEAIPSIVDMIQTLIEVGAAYDLDGDIYFSVAAAPHFGSVSGYDAALMVELAGQRGGDPGRIGKKDPLDPQLWQAARPGDPSWESRFGRGRPGWHIECATIAVQHLGPTIDVQGGGEDLIFPHHELSAAHAACATGVWPFSRTNVHQALVGYAGEKMSKSRGNLVFVSKLREAGIDPMAIRLALLKHGSRTPWEWHDAEIVAATEQLESWRAAVSAATGAPADAAVESMRTALAGGLDTPAAVAAVDSWVTATGDDDTAPHRVKVAIDALLGIQ